MQCLTCLTVNERKEPFYDLILTVEDQATLSDSLAQYFHYEMMDGDCKYECDVCQGTKQTARRTTCLTEIPPVLNFNLMRFNYHRTNFTRQKVLSRLAFPLTLDMQQYVSMGEEEEAHSTTVSGNNSVYIDTVVELALEKAIDIITKDHTGIKNLRDLAPSQRSDVINQMKAHLQPQTSGGGKGKGKDVVYELQAVLMPVEAPLVALRLHTRLHSGGQVDADLDGLMDGLPLADAEANAKAQSAVWENTVKETPTAQQLLRLRRSRQIPAVPLPPQRKVATSFGRGQARHCCRTVRLAKCPRTLCLGRSSTCCRILSCEHPKKGRRGGRQASRGSHRITKTFGMNWST